MSVAVKKISISLPESLWTKVEEISLAESRTRSELIREMIRRYAEEFDTRLRHQETPNGTVAPQDRRR